MTSTHPSDPTRVVVLGGGVAALEAVLALHDLAGARTHVTLVAPETEFVLRPLDVARPFARGHAGPVDLAAFMAEHDGRHRETRAVGVDVERRVVTCSTGREEPYDELIVAVGALASPAFAHALTFGLDPLLLNGLLADLEEGYSRSVAFIVPPGCTWPLPLYELALMTAEEVWGAGMDDVKLHFVTPEPSPLAAFGPEAGFALASLLDAARIQLHVGIRAEVDFAGHVVTGPGSGLDVQRIAALPVLSGRQLDGLPTDADGFIPVDPHGRVAGVPHVHAAGDAAGHPVKQGGLACQQADAVAADIAVAAGVPMVAPPYAPVLRGRLLTGRADRFLRRESPSAAGEVASEPLWWPPAKVSGRYLSPYLESRGLVTLPLHTEAARAGLDVDVSASRPGVPHAGSGVAG